MKSYSNVAVTDQAAILEIQRSMFLDITVGSADVYVRLFKKGSDDISEAEKGDFKKLLATRRYFFKSRKGAFWAVEHKTATGTSTFSLDAMNDEIIIVQPYPSS